MSERRRGGCWFAAALLLVTVPFAVTAAEYPVTGMVLKFSDFVCARGRIYVEKIVDWYL